MRRQLIAFSALCAALFLAAPALARDKAVCAAPADGYVSCDAHVRVSADGQPAATAGPSSGYRPVDLQTAYALTSAPASQGATQRVAIVDAYDDPYAAQNLATYRSTLSLPACGSDCFQKVNQTGGTRMPRGNASWSEEISLDLDMVSAICPNCKILLVEANSASFTDMLAAEDYASAHATVVSNSWGANEFSGESSYDSHFLQRSLPITFSSGDSGYGVEYPAASPYVTAVGGTTLARATSARGFSESAWSGASSGCSAFEPKPSWQLDGATCPTRTVADVSAVADPNTGVAVYDTYGVRGWLVFGGTSVASPIIASTYALAGSFTSPLYGQLPYAHTGSLFDVTTGSNGKCAAVTAYLCTAQAGYDGPTGLGTPNGIGAF
jgi:subtilase family serine protease